MGTTTDFEVWLDAVDVESEQEKDELIASVSGVSSAGDFTTTPKGSRYFVKGWIDDTLLLGSDKARAAFLAQVHRLNVPDETEEGYRHAINNPKS